MDYYDPDTDRSAELRALIMTCSAAEISAVIDATISRTYQLFPNDEVVYFSLPCYNDTERDRIIDLVASMLKKFKRNPNNR